MPTHPAADEVILWMMEGAPSVSRPDEVLQELCDQLHAGGIPIHRAIVFVTTLHPNVAGRRFLWEPGKTVAIKEVPYGYTGSESYLDRYVQEALDTGKSVRSQILKSTTDEVRATIRRMKSDGFTDYYVTPLKFTNGEVHAVAWATQQAGGFSHDDIETIEHIALALSSLAEIYALRRTAVNLLSTYVGHNTGERILTGRIKRGDVETIDAVVLFADLRNFTQQASSSEPQQLIDLLNAYFDCLVPEIEAAGGEVLKFMGDGVLAIFQTGDESDAESICTNALLAAERSLDRAESANRNRQEKDLPEIRFGIALHIGTVIYGNIGSADRLDFTVIGPAVNLAARMEPISGQVGVPIVCSAEFTKRIRRPVKSIGSFELKGVEGQTELFSPVTE